MSMADVETALVSAAHTALGSIPYVDENAPKGDLPTGKWAAIFYKPAQPVPDTIGSNGSDLVEGILQIDINYPRGDGTTGAKTDLETLRSAFKVGNAFISGTQEVRSKGCGHPYRRQVENWFRVSFTIEWWAHVIR